MGDFGKALCVLKGGLKLLYEKGNFKVFLW